jgi:predicted O-methyltransferase YrrM
MTDEMDFVGEGLFGQMKLEERKAMYELVCAEKPKRLLEIGTWMGGGSTYILSSAAATYGGHLDTVEELDHLHRYARGVYHTTLHHLLPFVTFHHGPSLAILPGLLRLHGGYDFVLLDGAEDSEQTWREFRMLVPFIRPDSLLACHDWGTLKMAKLRKVMERVLLRQDPFWESVVSMPDTATGFMVFRCKRIPWGLVP